ncbi:interferon-induced very large GTPase 1-like isoform X1 [Echeneis naucrates]|uniref:interferon-induced very large GTPase 1-like isoform X1 n=1 Tax=Echeneis naucrates TaxID=173247 RepID=UPI0011141536|nr:interferon-induced very large GTPase 1-like isoform X1 [Echeneis naucrates]
MENQSDAAETGGGGRREEVSEIKSLISSVTDDKVEELEESGAETKSDSVTEPGEAEHREQNETTTGGEPEIKCVPSETRNKAEADEDKDVNIVSSSNINEPSEEESDTLKDTSPTFQTVSTNIHEVLPELTLVLIGDTNAIEVGSNNILLGHAEQTHGYQFSSKLYDLCGRHISVINMLGEQNTDKFPLYQGVHAFVLLLAHGQHIGHDNSGVQWLVKSFGKESLLYLMTVVTHDSEEQCEYAMTELYDKSSLVGKRYHTCTKSMENEMEIIALLEKIDVMVSENDPHCYKRLCGENKEHEEDHNHKSHEEEKMDFSVCHPTQSDPALEEMQHHTDENKCQPVNDSANADHSPKSLDGTTEGGEREIKSPRPSSGIVDMDVNGEGDESVKISEEINRKKKKEGEIETLFHRLQLQDNHQQKLSPADFLRIGPTVKQDHETFEKDLAGSFLQRLMMLDYRARYIPVTQHSAEVSHSDPVADFDTLNTNESFLDAFFSSHRDSNESKQSHIHPMDVQMAVYHCSDSFLKQSMITKLSQCQYALPLLVPDPVTMDVECPLWTFRQIRKTWKITQIEENSTSIAMKSSPICKAETPMVSFFRLGSLSVSKSQLMSTLINDRHNTFFHRNCPGSTKSRHLLDGVAEIAWYCPSGKPNDAFTDCTAFCNLHGDALSNEKQRDILIDKASVNVVLLPTPKKGDKSMTLVSDLLESEKPVICLISDDDCTAVQTKKGKYKMGLKDRSQSDVSNELKRIIGEILAGQHTTFQLEAMMNVCGIRVDEDDAVIQKGKSGAMEVMKTLQQEDFSKIKDKFLPCQGRLWHEWCKTHKELYQLKGHVEKEKSKKEERLREIRQKQCDAPCSELMELFIGSMSSLPSMDKEFFLKWTQILIDSLSTDDLTAILQSYNEKWSEVLALKKKHAKSESLKRKQTELEQISTKLQSATFGLEHIFREMGQIYEAHKTVEKKTQRGQTDWSKYPELAAELMISGYPMELMDGDAGHVPLIWISSLLEAVIKKLGDQRVFVLSVLGVQSSGKSTMLNAMFGLQFAVSAGRCTKGAFMQLVKVSEEMKKEFQCDYVLVVDTEGLRALELAGNATLHHDNELATFVVGLGNMTLINIFGENPSEMQDVLQIVVQAFMRMKKVKLSPSCVFVHQNVTDIAAAEKNMDGKRRLQEKLDQMAQLAAKEEGCEVECFSDVIAFDVQKDVKYFAQLWEGSPPMAPPNPGYSESIQELKKMILSKASTSAGITLSQFKNKIQDLWNALLNEHFVFSFKNTLEIKVYRKLEVQYGNWTWALRSNMLTIENQLYNRIENGKVDKMELAHLPETISKTYGEVKKEMENYFDDADKETLVQWRGRFEIKIQQFHDDLVAGVKRKLEEVIQQKKACKKLDRQKTEFENKLLQKSKDLAHQLKDQAQDEEELKKQFDSVWNGWVKELTADTKPIEDINLEEDQMTVIQELGIEWALIEESRRNGGYQYISKLGDYFDYVILTKHREHCDETQQPEEGARKNKNPKQQEKYSRKGAWVTFKTWFGLFENKKSPLPYEEQQSFTSFIEKMEKQTNEIIQSKPVAESGYTSTYLTEVAKNVRECVTEFESEKKYALKKEFTVDLLLHVFNIAGRLLSESHLKFKKRNDALTYLESNKTQYYNIFRSFCKGNSFAVVLGELICEKLKVSMVEAACNKTAIDLAGEMRCNFPAFNGNRLNLEKHVLKSLAKKEAFDSFITYIKHPRKYVETFIEEEVNTYIFNTHKREARDVLKKNIEDLKRLVIQASFTATEKVKTQSRKTDEWLKTFSSLLGDVLAFDASFPQKFTDINDFDFLKEEVEKGLVPISEELSSLSLSKIKEFRQKPDQILIEQLCKCCWVKCPFCAAVCINTMEDHGPEKHNVPFHRPSGIEGWHTRGTEDLVIDFCTTLVASNRSFYPRHDSEEAVPFKQYQRGGDEYAQWMITADESKLTYWKWFVCRFQKQLEEHYNLKFQNWGEIPREWRKHRKDEAIKSLDEMYKCE